MATYTTMELHTHHATHRVAAHGCHDPFLPVLSGTCDGMRPQCSQPWCGAEGTNNDWYRQRQIIGNQVCFFHVFKCRISFKIWIVKISALGNLAHLELNDLSSKWRRVINSYVNNIGDHYIKLYVFKQNECARVAKARWRN